jgi:predicted Zn-dependent peptidase
MAFTIVADIEEKKMEKEVLKLTDKFFKDKDMESQDKTSHITPEPEQFDRTVSKRNHQANCIIGGLAPSLYQEKERLATVLLCNILGGPASNSILNSILREKNGWVYGVECSYTQFVDTGMVAITLGCDKANLEKCQKAIVKEIEKLQNELLTERKMRSAKKQLLGQLAISSDNGETQCLSMGKGLLAYGRITGGKETRELIEGISSEDVREMARRIFAQENLSRLIYI